MDEIIITSNPKQRIIKKHSDLEGLDYSEAKHKGFASEEYVNQHSGGGGTSNHAALSNLDYASSGHTGFKQELEKRHEWDSPYDYCFTAPLGSAEIDSVWTGNRITTNAIGEAMTETLYNVKWSERTIIF